MSQTNNSNSLTGREYLLCLFIYTLMNAMECANVLESWGQKSGKYGHGDSSRDRMRKEQYTQIV